MFRNTFANEAEQQLDLLLRQNLEELVIGEEENRGKPIRLVSKYSDSPF